MNHLTNEKGNAVFYLLWLLGIVALVFVLVINIAKVYIMKEQANTAVEQAALAGTGFLIEKTKDVIKEYDDSPVSILQKTECEMKTIEEIVDEKARGYNSLSSKSERYLRALNEVLPDMIRRYPELKEFFQSSFLNIETIILPSVQEVLSGNESNVDENTDVQFNKNKNRIEVKSTITFASISDGKWIRYFKGKIPQRGYGPSLQYLNAIFD
ncbi:Tad domain-containing protein [Bacillus testis]|uniref:Tad domain-containing protein n=1 Tax=Bacillus testis TaxID=1622072 RepID=UPI00067E916C|nr:Tad domain-containing protein [Bacillus testis]